MIKIRNIDYFKILLVNEMKWYFYYLGFRFFKVVLRSKKEFL